MQEKKSDNLTFFVTRYGCKISRGLALHLMIFILYINKSFVIFVKYFEK